MDALDKDKIQYRLDNWVKRIESSVDVQDWKVLREDKLAELGFSSIDDIKGIIDIPLELHDFMLWVYRHAQQNVEIMLLSVEDTDIAEILKKNGTPKQKTIDEYKQKTANEVTSKNRELMRKKAEQLGLGKRFYTAKARAHVITSLLDGLDSGRSLPAKNSLSNNETFARQYFVNAQSLGASDIHIESDGEKAKLFMRIHKSLCLIDKFPHQKAIDFANACYTTFNAGGKHSNSGTYVPTNHMEGEFDVPNTSLKGRLLSLYHGQGQKFNIVIRIIDKAKSVSAKSFIQMGFSEEATRQLSILETLSSGGIFVSGVTGSGKSTTIQNMIMSEIARTGGTKKIYSLEQPVEQIIPGVSQISVDGEAVDENSEEATRMDFATVNKRLMRGDPDSIAYGEVRDSYSASAAYKGVDSGHLVYATVHVDRALGAFGRLVEFGLSRGNVCRPGFIKLIVHQHLIARICPHCGVKHSLGEQMPPRFSEQFVLKDKLTLNEMSRYKGMSSRSGRPLLRLLQEDGRLTSKEVVKFREGLELLNSSNDADSMSERLHGIAHKSALSPDDIKITLQGPGCSKCFNGTIGITPAVEILTPDNTILDLLKEQELGKAELYWKSALGGRSIMDDMSTRILKGIVDPWNAETELGRLIGS